MLAHATNSTSPTATTIARSGVSKRLRSGEFLVAAATKLARNGWSCRDAPSVISGLEDPKRGVRLLEGSARASAAP